MPMPTGGPWPPTAFNAAYNAYRDWDAWYHGDPDRLRWVLAGRGELGRGGTQLALPRTRPSQYAGGVVGRLSRWFWGAPTPQGSKDYRLHCPLPADLAATAASLLFSEPVKLTPPDSANKAVADWYAKLMEDGLQATLRHAAEVNSALGDVYLRPVIDLDVWPDRAQLVAVHADGAIPTFRWGQLVEVTFHQCVEVDGQRHLRLLEHHSPGRIDYALFDGTTDTLGRPVPFAEHPDVAYLAELVDQGSGQDTGLDVLDVVRIPNSGPQRAWRTDPHLKYLGRSDFDGCEQWFDQADEAWSSWMRDLRLAKGRLVIPASYLQGNGPGQGASWDAEREVFTALTGMLDEGPQQITKVQFEIRVAEHRDTLAAITEVVLRHAGLSQQTMGEQGDLAVTATEVEARERRSFVTRDDRIAAWGPAIAQAVNLLMLLEQAKFSGKPEPVVPNVAFGDSVAESPETVARTVQLLVAAEAISVETRVRMVNPDWDDKQVEDEVQRIHAEGGRQVPNPDQGFFGGNRQPDPSAIPADAAAGV